MDGPLLDLHGAAFRADPYAELARLRAEHWHARTDLGIAVLTYAEVQQLLGMRELRTPGADLLTAQGVTDSLLTATMRGFLLNADGVAHARVRRLVGRAFTARRVEAFRPVVRSIVDDLITALPDEGDFVADFALPCALRVLYRFVGVPEDHATQVQRWTADVGLLFGFDVATHRDRIAAALRNLDRYLDELLQDRREDPREDLLSALASGASATSASDGERLNDAELRSLIITLMSAGQGTVQHQLANAMAVFLRHPAQWRRLADQPQLASTAAEEVVRFSPSALLGVPRIASTDVSLAGLDLPAGTLVLPVTGAANRDPLVFPAPDTFDITRTGAPHLTFGGGIHYCLGAALARVELQEALPRLAATYPAPRPAGDAVWLPPTEAVHGPLTLPVRFTTG